MRGQRRARCLAIARHDVDDTRRHAGFQPARRAAASERRLLGRLQHDGAARGERRTDLPDVAASGPFHGMMAPTTPTGSFNV